MGIAVNENSDLEKAFCSAFYHPTNRKIVELLAEENLSFTQMKNRIIGSCDSGKFGYHLRRLVGFVEFEPSIKKYKLTYRGRLLLQIICEFRSCVQKGNLTVKYAEQLAIRDHAFAVFNDESFKRDITFPFFKAGLAKGNAAFYAVSEEKLDSDVLALKKYGIDIEILPKGAFTVVPSFDWYLQKGKAEAKTILKNWQLMLEEKKKSGFKGLQIAAEIVCFIDNGKVNELLQCEELLGRQFGLDLCAICIYEKSPFLQKAILQVFRRHSHLISEEICGKTIV